MAQPLSSVWYLYAERVSSQRVVPGGRTALHVRRSGEANGGPVPHHGAPERVQVRQAGRQRRRVRLCSQYLAQGV